MTSIELLPDELWLKIFSYIPCLDLYPYFLGLNQRIDMLLSKQLKLKIKNAEGYRHSEKLIKTLENFVSHLWIGYYHQDVDISQFKNLTCLHLDHATAKQINLIESNYFKDLTRLDVVVCSPNNHIGDIVFGDKQYSNLKSCWLPQLDSYFQNDRCYKTCLTLRVLRLNYCRVETFHRLLCLLPNLASFESSLIKTSESEGVVCLSVNTHSALTYLKVMLRNCVQINDLESLMASIDHLRELSLLIYRTDTLERNFKLLEWAKLIQRYTPLMEKCDITIQFSSTSIRLDHSILQKISRFPDERFNNECITLQDVLAQM